jgi:hypothetical protein
LFGTLGTIPHPSPVLVFVRPKIASREPCRIGEEEIECEYDFLDLGSKIDENGGTLLDIQQRRRRRWCATKKY